LKSPIVLWTALAHDLASEYPAMCVNRDISYVSQRFEREGMSFLTITLPAFAKDFEKSLALGRVDSNVFLGFRRRRGLPAFMQGFLSQVFEWDGKIKSDVDSFAVFAVRQLTLLYSKILLECSDARKESAKKSYVLLEKEMEERGKELINSQLATSLGKSVGSFSGLTAGELLLTTWKGLFGDLLNTLESDLASNDFSRFVPRHGPGATTDGLVGNQKFTLTQWTERLEQYLPYGEFVLPNWRYYFDAEPHLLAPEDEPPVKVVLVPKTLKTPRVIAIESTAMQYAQQAVLRAIKDGIDQDYYLRNTIGFSGYGTGTVHGQLQNQELSQKGSLDGSLATIDLSEASDRVSNELVQFLFSHWPTLGGLIQSCRSARASVDGEVITLAKYASMGSALTFPIESMVFFAIVQYSRLRQARDFSMRSIRSKDHIGSYRVYGDDIIVPADLAVGVMADLEAFGFKVNASKSFWTGRFRESCGKEYFEGADVSIVRARRVLPNSRRDAREVISMVAMRNLFYDKGLWATAACLDEAIRHVLPYFPIVTSTSSVLGRHSIAFQPVGEKSCRVLHRPLVKAYVARPRPRKISLDGHGALVKFFVEGPHEDRRHLEHSGRPQRVDLTLGMVYPH